MKVRLVRSSVEVDMPAQDGRRITLMSGGVVVGWRGGGIIWQHPLAVQVEQGGVTQRIPIYDVTWRAIAGVALAGLALVVIISVKQQKQRGGAHTNG
jgi:hypothetical protein